MEAAILEVPDLEILEDSVDGLPMRIDRLDAAAGTVRTSMSGLPGMSIATGLTEMPIRSGGGVVDDAIVVGVPLSAGVGSWSGVNLASDRAWCYGTRRDDGVTGGPATARWHVASRVRESLGDGSGGRADGDADLPVHRRRGFDAAVGAGA